MTWEIGAYSVESTLPTPTSPPVATTGWDIGAYDAQSTLPTPTDPPVAQTAWTIGAYALINAWDIGAYAVGSSLPTPTDPDTTPTGWDIGAYRTSEVGYYYYVNMPVGSDSYYVNFPVVSTYDYYINLVSAVLGLSTPEDPPVATTGWVIGAYKV